MNNYHLKVFFLFFYYFHLAYLHELARANNPDLQSGEAAWQQLKRIILQRSVLLCELCVFCKQLQLLGHACNTGIGKTTAWGPYGAREAS